MKVCDHGNSIDPENGLNCIFCMAGASKTMPMPDGMREQYLEQALGFILREAMHDQNGDQVAGVATALKRTWLAGFKTGQAFPETRH